MDVATAAARVPELMPQLEDELAQLVAIPSISASSYPEETRPALQEAHDADTKSTIPARRDQGLAVHGQPA